jgi:two-component system NtrC family sensor kinase
MAGSSLRSKPSAPLAGLVLGPRAGVLKDVGRIGRSIISGGRRHPRIADINAIVEDSLNLAYHGARAEKSGYAITLRPDFAPDAGAAELYPQEITRALLNLISNGFYAAIKRKVESGDESFEPVLSAFTRNLGKAVEIRIRDNGSGIPPT